MAVALDDHHLVDHLGPEADHPAHVVAGEVDEHDVLGHLLRVLDQLALQPGVLLRGATAGSRPGDRTGGDRSLPQAHHRLGRRSDHGDLGEPQEVEIGTRVHQPQDPVDVEGVDPELGQVEPLGQHRLEDVAGVDVLLGGAHRILVEAVGHGPGHVVGRELAGRQRPGGLGRRTHAVDGQLVEAGLGVGMGTLEVVVAPRRVDHHVVDQHHPLAPVVEGGELSDDGQDGVGLPEVVWRRVRQVLDLPDHVVAEVADEPGVQRRQVGQVRRVERAQDRLERGQDPVRAGDPAAAQGVEIEVAPGRHVGAVGHDGGQRVAADERVATPALTAFHRFEQEAARVTGADDLEEGRDRGDGVGHQLAPHRHDPVPPGECPEVVGRGGGGHRHEGDGPPVPPVSSPKAR